MEKRIKIIIALIIISLAAVSCKAPCGCSGRGGYGEMINKTDNQVEQRA